MIQNLIELETKLRRRKAHLNPFSLVIGKVEGGTYETATASDCTMKGVVYFGPDTSITTSNSPGIAPGGNFCEDSGATNTWKGDIYGIVSAGTASIRYWERTQA